MRRELPPTLSFEALFEPRRDHPYFEDAAAHPFRPSATDYDPANVWWLADASLLAYVPEPDFVRDALLAAGLDEVEHYAERSTHAFAAWGDDRVIVAFRGTEPGDLDDLRTDLDLRLEPWPGGGAVHRGFLEALDLVWTEMSDRLARLGSDRAVWFTGHSLGAALATLASRRLEDVRGLATFGSPRVGDRTFRDGPGPPTWRVVNNNDVVCRVPPPVLYRHVGARVYVDRHGTTRLDTTRWERALDEAVGHGEQAVRLLERWRHGEPEAIPWDALVDHSPIHYALHAWNAMIDAGR